MLFTKEDFISNLYETSKSKDSQSTPLLSKKEAKHIEVYDFDKYKLVFCHNYRNGQELGSCDAFYRDNKKDNALLIEFKNTHHFKFKQYMKDFNTKLADSHMLLMELFYNKRNDISKCVKVLVIYKDENQTLSYETGIMGLCSNLNILGNQNNEELFCTETEYENDINEIIERFKGEFYREIEFMDYKDFKELYLDSKYFGALV